MDRTAIVNAVKNFQEAHDVSIDDIVVGYDAAAVMHGLRYSTDAIELDVHTEEFEQLSKLDEVKLGLSCIGKHLKFGELAVHVEEHNDYELVDGIWVVGLKTLLRQFRMLFNHPGRSDDDRRKDLRMIKLFRNI